jgi:hypothetical protein
MLKKCSKCRKDKDWSEFYKNRSAPDGLAYWCKDCTREYRQTDKSKKRTKEYYKNNKNYFSEYTTSYQNTKDGYKHNWCGTLHRHRYKGIEIHISSKELFEFIQDKNTCAICGKTLNWSRNGKKGGAHDSPTLDRINNENYIDLNNIQILCYQCNVGKQKMTNGEYINQCKMVLENNGYIVSKK